MNQEEYKKRLLEIESERNQKINSLKKEYAMLNNPYKIGDVITDHMGSIKIESVHLSQSSSILPCCSYFGLELKKDGTPKKNNSKRRVWQENLIN